MNSTSLKPFLTLWSTQAVSLLGSSLTRYALILWVYQQAGTISCIAGLSIATYLPSILFCFLAGTLADKWDKKIIMLISDAIAALGTLTIMLLYVCGHLQLWHLYAINLLISFMDAFQAHASYVATSLLVPPCYYARASSLQSFSSSLAAIFTPALATTILSFTNLTTIFIIDILTFFVAFLTLAFVISIPAIKKEEQEETSFHERAKQGIRFLYHHRALRNIILFFSFINLLSSMSDNSLLPALILSKTNQNTQLLGIVSAMNGIGAFTGSIVSTCIRMPRSSTRVIFISCAISCFSFGIPLALSDSPRIWMMGAFLANFPLPILNTNLTTLMRTHVPITMQGRVFSARDTLQYITIPIGLVLGGFLCDQVFEPWMSYENPFSMICSPFLGFEKGSGIAFMFLITGLLVCLASLLMLRNTTIRTLDNKVLDEPKEKKK